MYMYTFYNTLLISPAHPKTTPPDSTHRAQFVDLLMKTFTSEAVFLLTTFANMARARHDNQDSEGERQFISTIALEIFEVHVHVQKM